MIVRALALLAVLLLLAAFLAITSREPEQTVDATAPATTTTTAWPQESIAELPLGFDAKNVERLIHPPKPPVRARTAPKVVRHAQTATYKAAGASAGHACGGDLPPCYVMLRESGGNPRAVNPTGCGGRGCYGKWQYDPRTWRSYGGYAFASDAPESVQDDKARQDWNGGAGCRHWSAC